jgi:CRP/FNR family transcriptional regulator
MDFSANFKNTFEPALLNEIFEKAIVMSFNDGDTIIDIGQTVRFVPLLLEGILKVSRTNEEGKDLLLYYIRANESCAITFTCCMQRFPSEIKATAENDVVLRAIPISFMDEWLIKYPTWKSFVMKTIHNRFNELLNTIDQIAFTKLDKRLAHYLKEKSKATNSTLINLSHEQIANEMATSREVISRLLKQLENDKKLLLYRNQIKLLPQL